MALKKHDKQQRKFQGSSRLPILQENEEFRIKLPDGRELRFIREGMELTSEIADSQNTGEGDNGLTILGSSEPLAIRPILPNLPLVLQPETELHILPKAGLQSTVILPLGIALTTMEEASVRLIKEFFAEELSKTWFGTPDEGEAAYSWKTSLTQKEPPETESPWAAVCPLIIQNDSPEILNFQKMILRVPELSLYTDGRLTLTDAVTIRFRGQTQVSQISINKETDPSGARLAKLTGPRIPPEKDLLKRSFAVIKTISQG